MVIPTNSRDAERLQYDLTTQRNETLDAMRNLLDRHRTQRGDDTPLQTNDADALDRLERKCDRIDSELAAIGGQFPSLNVPQLTLRQITRTIDEPLGDDSAQMRGSRTAGQSMVEWATEHRDANSSGFHAGHAAEFSMGRYLRGALTGNWADADLERRVLSEGTDSAGGYIVPTMLASSVIDKLKPATQVIKAGAQVIALETDQLDLPRVGTGVTAGWRAENAAIAESDPAFERVQLAPKSLAVMTRISRELLEDMPEVGLSAIEGELTSALAVELDRAALLGTGSSNQPTGVLNQTGVSLRTNGTNGASVSWAIVGDAVAQLRAANVEPTGLIWAPRTTASLAALVDTTNQPLRAPQQLAAIPQYDSTSVPVNLTVGSSSACSYVFAGDWSQLVIGVRPSLRVEVIRDASRYLDVGQVAIVAHLRADVGLLRPAAFAVESGVKA